MILSKDQVKKIIEGAPQGSKPEDVVNGLLSRGYQLEGLNDTQQPEKKGFIRNVAEGIATPFAKVGVQGANVLESTARLLSGDIQGASKALDKSRNVPGLGQVSPVISGTQAQNESFGTQIKKSVGTGAEIASNLVGGGAVKGVIGNTVKGLAKQGLVTGLKTGALSGALQGAGQGLEEDKGLIETGLRTVVGSFLGGTVGGAAGGALPLVNAGVKKALLPVEQKISNVLRESIDKGIKPYFGNKATPALRDAYYKKAEDAFAIIHKYKPTLLDENLGEEVAKSPTSRKEMLEALGKAKKSIYEQYSGLSKQSGEAGAQFDANAIVDELTKASKDLKKPPQIRRYAEEMINEISELDGQPPDVIEARIQDLNQSLAGFYEGRTTKAKAQIDASVANLMRTKLDEIIEKSTGRQYQALKNEYGALKAVEKDLTRQVALEARKNVKGVADMTDIFTGGDIVSGAISGNPALLARGLAGKAVKEYNQYLNNPNRYIKRAFDILDNPPADIKKAVEEAVSYAQNNAGLSVQDVSKTFKAAKNALQQRIEVELPKVQALVNTGAASMDDYALVKTVSEKYKSGKVVTVEDINKVNRLLNSLREILKAYDKYGVDKSIPLNGRRAYVNGKTILKPLTGESSLLQEAKKYKSAEEFVKANLEVDTLLPSDRPMGEKTLSDLKYTGNKANTQKVNVSPIEDVINEAKQVADSGGDGSVGNYEVYDVLKKVKNGRIKVYHGTSEAGANAIGGGWAGLKDGSYLSLTKGAEKEAMGVYGAKYYADIADKYGKGGQVLEFEIPLKNVAIDKTTGELRYVSDKTKSQLTDIWNKANKK